MRSRAVRLAALVAAIPAALGFAALPAWGLLQLLVLAVLGGLLTIGLGGFGAGCMVVMLLALQGSNPHAEGAFGGVLLPVLAVLSGGCALASVVAAFPSLGRRIEHGPFGPGGP